MPNPPKQPCKLCDGIGQIPLILRGAMVFAGTSPEFRRCPSCDGSPHPQRAPGKPKSRRSPKPKLVDDDQTNDLEDVPKAVAGTKPATAKILGARGPLPRRTPSAKKGQNPIRGVCPECMRSLSQHTRQERQECKELTNA